MSARRIAFACCLVASAPSARGAGLTPEELAGKRIYFEGTGASSGQISARIGPDTQLSATFMPCANCHGDDAQGRPEGGLLPPEITWSRLHRPYGHRHSGGRSHPTFTEQTLARALATGIDPGGNRMDPAMPRYSMSGEDMASLIAYLKRIETDRDPGISDTEVVVGTVLPSHGRLAESGRAIEALLEAYFRELNARGGIHGRRVRLRVSEYDGSRSSSLATLRRLFAEERVFALVAPFLAGMERELSELADQHRVPVIGPLTFLPRQSESPAPQIFYLLPGIEEQARVLSDFAVSQLALANPPVAILFPQGDGAAGAAGAALGQLERHGWKRARLWSYPRGKLPPGLARELGRAQVQVAFFLGDDRELSSLLRAGEGASWSPYLLLPGALGARAAAGAPPTFRGRIYLAYPTLPSDENPAAKDAFEQLRAKAGASQHRTAQVLAYTAAAVLAEGLRQGGRRLSRSKLTGVLETLYSFEPGLVPPLTFSPTRRVGARGAYVVRVEVARQTFRPVTGWMEPSERP